MNDIAPVKQQRRDLKEALLDPDMQAVFGALVPRHMTAERMLRLSIACITRTPKLLEVPQVQVLGALVQCAGIGLEPNSPLQHVHLIPFKNNRTQRYELQTIIGYRGFVELGRRTGKQKWVHGDVVRPGDEFSYTYGNDAHLQHRPGRGAQERQVPTDAYCFVQLDDGFAFVVLPEWEILRHRQHSFAWRQDGEKSPWGQHPDRMWRKTAIRVLYGGGEVPLDTELAMAINTDDQRMDYRAIGELAMRGGKAALEHLKEGMDTFVAAQDDEPEAAKAEPELRPQIHRVGPPTPREPAPQTAPGGPQPAMEQQTVSEGREPTAPSDGAPAPAQVTILGKPYERLGAARTALLKAIAEWKEDPAVLAANATKLARALRSSGRSEMAEEIERRLKAKQEFHMPAPADNGPPADFDDAMEGDPEPMRYHPETGEIEDENPGEFDDGAEPYFEFKDPATYEVVGSFAPSEFLDRVTDLTDHAPNFEYLNKLRTYTSSALTQIRGLGREWENPVDDCRVRLNDRIAELRGGS